MASKLPIASLDVGGKSMSSEMQIRKMLPSDTKAASELGIRSKASWGYSGEQMDIFSQELALDEEIVSALLDAQVAVLGDEIVGYYTLVSRPDAETEIEHLFVDPCYFHRGIGSFLLSSARESARAKGINRLTIVADPNSTAFYLKQGAVVTGEHASSIKGRTIPVLSISTQKSSSRQGCQVSP